MSRRNDALNALRFLTVLPVPASDAPFAPDWLTRALVYFPAVGILIGCMSAVMLLIADLLWGHSLAAICAVAASIAMTGALHEDGLADTFDALGGGWSIAKRLEIMKDSRIGTYGALALMIGIALRIGALIALPIEIAACALIAGHAAARSAPALVMMKLSYAGDGSAMKVAYEESKPRAGELIAIAVCVVIAAWPLFWLAGPIAAVGWAGALMLGAAMTALSQRMLHGYTGDALGAIEQCSEIGLLLGVVAVAG